MPKEKNAKAVELIGSPDKLIGKIITGRKSKKWAIEKITVTGPPHKQLQHTLVLKRLGKLVDAREKSTGKKFQPFTGETLQTEEENNLPISIPAASMRGLKNAITLIEKMSAGPEHEILFTAILLQAIEYLLVTESGK